MLAELDRASFLLSISFSSLKATTRTHGPFPVSLAAYASPDPDTTMLKFDNGGVSEIVI